jgi:hypothetical protein
MAKMHWRFALGLIAAALAATLVPAPAPACPFCIDERGKTLVDDYLDSSLVIFGSFTNPKLDATGGIDSGTTDFVIEKALKSHDVIKGKKLVTLPKYVPASKSKWILFCDVYKGDINPYRGEEVVPGSKLLDYLTDALNIKDQAIGKRLRHCFDFLNSSDLAVSVDAYREFAKADYDQYKDIAKELPAATLAGWLQDEKTPNYRFGLYASLLGHCGESKKHGDLLKSMINDPRQRMGSGLDGMMAGYVLLQPKEGFACLEEALTNDQEEFHFRYAALRTLRFFWEFRPDVLSKEKVIKAFSVAAEHTDIADFAIEDLRTWKAWNLTDKVLDLFGKESHSHSTIKRSIMRFALASPEKRAKAFVAEQQRLNSEWVEEVREMLAIDTPAPKAKTESPKKDPAKQK